MSYLIDTHVLLWWMDNSNKLSQKEKDVISKSDNLILISSAVIWEIRIKESLGKLKIPSDFFSTVQKGGFQFLSIDAVHTNYLEKLPLHHRDPFDRILISQAILENLTIITHDAIFKKYEVSLLKSKK